MSRNLSVIDGLCLAALLATSGVTTTPPRLAPQPFTTSTTITTTFLIQEEGLQARVYKNQTAAARKLKQVKVPYTLLLSGVRCRDVFDNPARQIHLGEKQDVQSCANAVVQQSPSCGTAFLVVRNGHGVLLSHTCFCYGDEIKGIASCNPYAWDVHHSVYLTHTSSSRTFCERPRVVGYDLAGCDVWISQEDWNPSCGDCDVNFTGSVNHTACTSTHAMWAVTGCEPVGNLSEWGTSVFVPDKSGQVKAILPAPAARNEEGPGAIVFMIATVASLVLCTLCIMCVVCNNELCHICGRRPAAAATTDVAGVDKKHVFDEDNNNSNDDGISAFLPDDDVKFPQYWTNAGVGSDSHPAFSQMAYVSSEKLHKFSELLDLTYKPKATQDRPCPKQIHPRTPGGCRCVQVDGNPGLPRGYKVKRAIRIEDSNMWRRYLRKREQIKRKRDPTNLESPDPHVATNRITNMYADTFETLATDVNEVYIWHGTPVRKALSIAQDSFKIDLAGTARGAMYGPGAYLAESSTKADEYAMDDPGGYYEGIFAMLLCRACLGRFYYTTDRDVHAHEKIRSGEFDSTCGDREKSANTFREFVVYNADQLYPEYVILYSRITKNSDDNPVLNGLLHAPFHMQVPVCWRNCHHDPYTQPFHEQYVVRKSTTNLLQRLVNASLVTDWARVTIVKARRVENSSTWSKYIKFKSELQRTLRDADGRFSQPEELANGHQRRRSTPQQGKSSFVVTHAHLLRENLEEVISVDNLEESLNEFVVWHGTDKAAAEAIAHDDFRVPWSGRQRHGHRYGPGIYLSDNLSKALLYTNDTEDFKAEGVLVRHVLLCRMLCGEIYYSELDSDPDLTGKCIESSANSVLAYPKRREACEFIAVTEDQVYPEYILELEIWPYKTCGVGGKTVEKISTPASGGYVDICDVGETMV